MLSAKESEANTNKCVSTGYVNVNGIVYIHKFQDTFSCERVRMNLREEKSPTQASVV